MIDQIFEGFRKASESSLQMQQEMFRQWTQQLQAVPESAAGLSTEWGRTFQKRWLDLALELLHKHRESLDTTYKSGIQLVEQSFRLSEAKSSEDYRKTAEDLWRKLFETYKDQSEAQFRDFQTWAERSFEMARTSEANARPPATRQEH